MTYEEIAQSRGLDTVTAARFCQYMRARWADQEALHCEVGYASEWADRFHDGREFAASDQHGQDLLRSMT